MNENDAHWKLTDNMHINGSLQLKTKTEPSTSISNQGQLVYRDDNKIHVVDENQFDSYWKSFPILDDIELPPSIFIFHPYNTLYFVYYEEEKIAVKSLKSALKQSSSGRMTKRVRWAKHQRKTRGRGNPGSL